MANKHQYMVISDIGSTTTKAMLIKLGQDEIALLGMHNSETTVEAPHNDVRIGVIKAIRGLEADTGIPLLAGTTDNSFVLNNDIGYLTSSSAGGGLQILVIGLTLFDSASSGRRAALGAGGIILDTFALDDKRKAIDQMMAIRNLHPDLVLVCGGTDGGAVTGVLRLTEILRLANPSPKFEEAGKIPAIYAGNVEAAQVVRHMISADFDLHILPNLRPSPTAENLKPTQEMIQKLFMENVMEKAPGYAGLKGLVKTEIKPTPLAVLDCLDIFSAKGKKNILAIDIGGATTDIFTYINGHSQRTVSANLGMSYSALNVMKEYSPDKLMSLLPKDVDSAEVRNYIGNKTITPLRMPENDLELMIEHALAKAAISMAIEQHQEMHYNTMKIGFLDTLKLGLRDKYEEKFEYQKEEESHYFYTSDIDIVIGAGGIFAHVSSPEQAMMILCDACRPKGITELWLDESFCSPHIGILSSYSPESAEKLLANNTIRPIGVHLSPTFRPSNRKDKILMHVETGDRKISVRAGELHYIDPRGSKLNLKVTLTKDVSLGKVESETSYETSLPVIIDTRTDICGTWDIYPLELADYDRESRYSIPLVEKPVAFTNDEYSREIVLPYQGEIYTMDGANVSPQEVLAANPFDPARLFIVQPYGTNPFLSSDLMLKNILVKKGDSVDFDQPLAYIPNSENREFNTQNRRTFFSPVRGKVEYIDFNTGLIVMSEIQDYSSKPVKINASKLLKLKNNKISSYVTKLVGDFVYQGEVIARKVDRTCQSGFTHVKSPTTGTIVSIDNTLGEITVQYLAKPHEYKALVYGRVKIGKTKQELSVHYNALREYGKIGFGRETGGLLISMGSYQNMSPEQRSGKILYTSRITDHHELMHYAESGIIGLICDTIDEEVLVKYLNQEPGVINTGGEALPCSLLILSGFAKSTEQSANLSAIRVYGDHYVYLNPHTRLRAGVIRPSLNVFSETK